MKIKQDLLRIRSVPYDDKGNKIEPEQQTVQRVLRTDAAASVKSGEKVGTIPTEVVYEMNAAQFAGAMRTPCFSCKHFDSRAWLAMKAVAEDPTGPKENREWLNGIRAYLLETQNASITDAHQGMDGDMDVEHALSQLGVCRPLTEINRDPIVVYPTATCPGEVCTPDKPMGLYDAKDKDSERMGSGVYDEIMRRATGRLP